MFTYKTGMKIQHVDAITDKPLDVYTIKNVREEQMDVETDAGYKTTINVEVIETTTGKSLRRYEVIPLEPVMMSVHELYLALRFSGGVTRRYFMEDGGREILYVSQEDRLYLVSKEDVWEPWTFTSDEVISSHNKTYAVEVTL